MAQTAKPKSKSNKRTSQKRKIKADKPKIAPVKQLAEADVKKLKAAEKSGAAKKPSKATGIPDPAKVAAETVREQHKVEGLAQDETGKPYGVEFVFHGIDIGQIKDPSGVEDILAQEADEDGLLEIHIMPRRELDRKKSFWMQTGGVIGFGIAIVLGFLLTILYLVTSTPSTNTVTLDRYEKVPHILVDNQVVEDDCTEKGDALLVATPKIGVGSQWCGQFNNSALGFEMEFTWDKTALPQKVHGIQSDWSTMNSQMLVELNPEIPAGWYRFEAFVDDGIVVQLLDEDLNVLHTVEFIGDNNNTTKNVQRFQLQKNAKWLRISHWDSQNLSYYKLKMFPAPLIEGFPSFGS